ncbi:MAG: transglycosylase domain-containing protein [Saprospiraceae bacterium]|nr:transglycosylase domain-containing protein [Saprospiraceae bacterium]
MNSWDSIKRFLNQLRKDFKFTDIYSGKTTADKSWFSSAVLMIWKILFAGIGFLYLCLIFVSFDNLPSFKDLENPSYNQASIVYANDLSILGKYYTENREFIPYDSLNQHLVHALLSTEDSRYYKHSGIDFFALMRVAFKTILLSNEESGGGSTITQQLAKLLFERPNLEDRNKIIRTFLIIRVKMKEWLTAIKLEKSYTKEEILAMYLNKFDFLYGANGVQTAAQTYFGKNQKELNLNEAAMIIGMLKNPTRFNPKRFPKIALDRRNTVLALMFDKNFINAQQLKAYSAKTIDITQFKRESHLEGMALYFRAELSKYLKNLLDDERYRKADGTKYNFYEDGLKIYTTIDPVYQKYAEDAAREHMLKVQKSYFNVWTKQDPWTYDSDENMLKIRKDALNLMIRETERFNLIWNQHFGNIIAKMESEIGNVDMNDRTIQRLINEEKETGFLEKELKKKLINQSQYEYSHKILKSKQWPAIKKEWLAFETNVRKSMTTPVKMKVYDYITMGEKDTLMSPLDSIKFHRKHMQIGSIAMDPHTGEVKAWVGGTNFKYFKYDHVNSRRQVGSTFKPFVYATAIALQGISPCSEFQDVQYTIPADDPNFHLPEAWSPGNAAETFSGENMNLYRALALSKNSISVKLVILLGSVEPIRGLLNNMGIDSSLRRRDGGYLIPKYPSIVLGSSDLSVLEMTGAYTTFANNGIYTKPVFINRIEDKNGKVIYRSTPTNNVALSPNYNYVMVDLLRKSGGTWGVKVPNGGKTGTTNDYVDGWYMGITPNLVVGTWVGGEDPWIRFLSLELGQGSAMAKPFFTKFITKLELDQDSGFNPAVEFIRPSGDIGIELDCETFRQMMSTHNADHSLLPKNNQSTDDEIFEEEPPKKDQNQ